MVFRLEWSFDQYQQVLYVVSAKSDQKLEDQTDHSGIYVI